MDLRHLTTDIPLKKRHRAGMVGGGKGAYFAGIHRAAMRLSNRFELVAGSFSSDVNTTREAAAALEIARERTYDDFKTMAASEAGRADPIDVAVIVTPNHLHFEPCKLFLEAGIPVICEKPLVNTSEEAFKLQEIASKNDTFFAVTYTYTGYPMVRDARARIREGEIGEVQFLYAEYLLEWLADDPARLGKGGIWRGDPNIAGPTGVMGDIGTHVLNMLEFVSGKRCTAVSANLLNTKKEFGLDDTDIVQLRFHGGANGLFWCSLNAPGHRNGLKIKIIGTRGCLEWSQEAPETLHLSRLSEADLTYRRGQRDNTPDAFSAISLPAGNPEGYIEALANLYCDYAQALDAGPLWRRASAIPIADLEEGIRGVILSEVSLQSNSTSQWVSFPKTNSQQLA